MAAHSQPRVLIDLELDLLDSDERSSVVAHLKGCDACFQRQQVIRAELETIAEEIGGQIAAAPEVKPLRSGRHAFRHRSALLAAAAMLVVGIGLGRWIGAPERERVLAPSTGEWRPALVAGTPVRLLGHRAAGAPPLMVTIREGQPLVLFLKVAAPIDSAAEYEIVLRAAGGTEERTQVSGSIFDGAGTAAVLVPPGFAASGTIAVLMESAGADGRRVVFQDEFAVQRVEP